MYKPIQQGNYGEICRLGNEITADLSDRKVPEPGKISAVLGEGALIPYYLMHALLYSIEHGRVGGVLHPVRRDGIALQLHSFDSAFKPYFRFYDGKMPSGYALSKREINVLDHDLGEEFGKSLLGALVINDIVGYLVSRDAGRDVGLLTNKNALLLDPLEGLIKMSLARNTAGNDDPADIVYDILAQKMSEVAVTAKNIQRHYRRALGAFEQFRAYVRKNVGETPDAKTKMPNAQKRLLLDIISEMHSKLLLKIDSEELLSPDEATSHIRRQYDNVMNIVETRDFIEADARLILPEEPEFLLTLEKTLYRDFMRAIANDVKANAVSASESGLMDDGYLAPMMEKIADSTHNVANMERTPLTNAASIFRKARIVITTGRELQEYLREHEIDSQRLQEGVSYLYRNLDEIVSKHLDHLQDLVDVDDNWKMGLEIFEVMEVKMGELENIIAAGQQLNQSEKNIGQIQISIN